jgi:diguanylate cyclase (GGDEF)-like protein
MNPPKEDAPVARILVIDHDPYILRQVGHILRQRHYELLTATSGQAGLNLFNEERPNLVLLDLELADVNSLDVLGQMKERRRYVPVLVMAAASEMAAIASLRRGADDYLSKPLSPEELLDRIHHNLERGRQARSQAELTDQLQRQLAILLSVREVAREASSTTDLYQLLHRVLDQTLQNLNLDAGLILVSENGDLVPLAYRGLPPAIASALTRRRLTWHDPALRAVQEPGPAFRTQPKDQQGGPLSLSVGYHFTAVVPLWAQGLRRGLLEVAGREERSHVEQDLEVLTTVGQQLAVALANTRLQETAALRVRELALLNEACLALTSDLDLEQILTTIMLRTSDVIGVETGSLLLVDEVSGELTFRISLGGDADNVLSRRIPPGKGISGWVFQQGQSLLVPDVTQDPRYYPEVDYFTGFQTRSILCVPLRVRGACFGVIELVNKVSGEFSGGDLRLLESVAALTATAIEQSRLHEWTTSFIMVDPVTRLPNHRLFLEALEREESRARRYTRTCSVLALAVDRRLHLPDPRWRDLAVVLKKALRQSDLLCRHRDGRFVAILPETGIAGARQLVGRLMKKIRQAGLQDPSGVSLADSIRCGLSTYPDTVEDPKGLLAQAEDALAQAWQEGAECGEDSQNAQ